MAWNLFVIDPPGEDQSYWDLPTGACWYGDKSYGCLGDDYNI